MSPVIYLWMSRITRMLQSVTVCCSVLQCVWVICSFFKVLQCVAASSVPWLPKSHFEFSEMGQCEKCFLDESVRKVWSVNESIWTVRLVWIHANSVIFASGMNQYNFFIFFGFRNIVRHRYTSLKKSDAVAIRFSIGRLGLLWVCLGKINLDLHVYWSQPQIFYESKS